MNLSVIGINRVSLSIAQILRERAAGFTVMGFDPDAKCTRQAAHMKVFNRTAGSLRPAVENTDVIILSLPLDHVQDVLSHLSHLIPAQTVLIDTSNVKQPVLSWAREHLPGNPFISIFPCIHPRWFEPFPTIEWDIQTDLFKNSPCFIVTSAQSTTPAMQFADRLVGLLEANPVLIDAGEIDSCLAGAEHLPRLLAAAYLKTIIRQPVYRDTQKLAGEAFYQMVTLAAHFKESDASGQNLAANRQNLTRLLDDVIDELANLKILLDPSHQEELQKYLTETTRAGGDWLKRRTSGDFESPAAVRGTRRINLLRGLFDSSLLPGRKRSP